MFVVRTLLEAPAGPWPVSDYDGFSSDPQKWDEGPVTLDFASRFCSTPEPVRAVAGNL